MRKVFTDELPHKGIQVNWIKSVGYEVSGVYDTINFKIKIIEYYIKNKHPYLMIEYKNKPYPIAVSHFSKCNLGKIFPKQETIYKYNINSIVSTKIGKIKILKQFKNKWKNKSYVYCCCVCGNIDKISASNLAEGKGCNVCSGKKVKIGYNDMWTTNPELAKLLADPEDGYKYTQNSHKYVDWKCPNCGNVIKNKRIEDINKRRLSCPKCSDKIPYTEKFVFNVLQQLLQSNFVYQLSKTTFKWCDKYLYDFYFKINNEEYILETHGLQHYEESPRGRSLKEEQENDKIKKELAIKNGIKPDNYIVIDCRYSELKWIKEHILKSRLNELFGLSKIDWLDCHKYACSSLVKKVCDLWNNCINSITEISKIIKLSQNTVIKYLKQGKLLNWCEYSPKNNKINNITYEK